MDERIDTQGERPDYQQEVLMSKELFMAAHDELVQEYLEAHPDADWSEAYERTADRAQERYADKVGDMIDHARMQAKYDR